MRAVMLSGTAIFGCASAMPETASNTKEEGSSERDCFLYFWPTEGLNRRISNFSRNNFLSNIIFLNKPNLEGEVCR